MAGESMIAADLPRKIAIKDFGSFAGSESRQLYSAFHPALTNSFAALSRGRGE
jgi:hypothetical protein